MGYIELITIHTQKDKTHSGKKLAKIKQAKNCLQS